MNHSSMGRAVLQIAPSDWSADGRFIAYTLIGAFPSHITISGSFRCPAIANRFRWHKPPSRETQAVFSPDGRWIAYTTNEGGQLNVFVQPFPATGGKYPGIKGRREPSCLASGRQGIVLHRSGRDHDGGADRHDRSSSLPACRKPCSPRCAAEPAITSQVYAVTKDGQRFLVNARPQQSSAAPLTVVVNWTATIQK